MRTRILVITATLSLLTARPARAEGVADSAAGAALFAEGQKLMEQGKIAAACAKLEAARALVTSTGALLSLGDCYEKNGQTASAYGAFKEAGILARRLGEKDRDAEAKRRAELVEPRLSKIVIEVAAGNRAPVTVQQNGRAVPAAAFGSAVPVDPGEHTLDASSPGKETWKAVVRVPAGPGETRVQVPVLGEAPVLADKGAAPAQAGSWWGGQRIAGVAVAAAGAVGLALGGVFGGMALGKNEDSKAACAPGDPSKCTPEGIDLRRGAYGLAHASTASFVVGGAAVVGGVVLLATGKAASGPAAAGQVRVAPLVGQGLGGVVVQGAW